MNEKTYEKCGLLKPSHKQARKKFAWFVEIPSYQS